MAKSKTRTSSHPRTPFTREEMLRSSITHYRDSSNQCIVIQNSFGCGANVAIDPNGCGNIHFLKKCSEREFWYAVGAGLSLSHPFYSHGNRKSYMLNDEGIPVNDLFESLAIAGEKDVLIRILEICSLKTVARKRRRSLLKRASEADDSATLAEPKKQTGRDDDSRPVRANPTTSSGDKKKQPNGLWNKNVIVIGGIVMIVLVVLIVL